MGLITNPIIPDEDCTLATCTLAQAHIHGYVPTLAGNVLYAGIFGLILFLQLGLGVYYKTWGYMVGMVCGCTLEIIGYIARIQMHFNPFTDNPFLMYLCCLTIGPAFLSASIYLCLARIIVVYGESLSRFKPRTYTITFMTCDFFSLLLQAAGGAIASSSNDQSSNQMGINIMVAGVSFQVFSLGLFAALCMDFAWSIRRTSNQYYNPDFAGLRSTFKFKAFMCALIIATLTIFVRSVFRCAELSAGFDGALANDQITFMILEGAMVVTAVTALTVFHPGLALQGRWADAGWTLREKKDLPKEISELDSGFIAGRKWYAPWKKGSTGHHGLVIQLGSQDSGSLRSHRRMASSFAVTQDGNIRESALTSVSLGEPPAYEQGVYSTPVVRNFV